MALPYVSVKQVHSYERIRWFVENEITRSSSHLTSRPVPISDIDSRNQIKSSFSFERFPHCENYHCYLCINNAALLHREFQNRAHNHAFQILTRVWCGPKRLETTLCDLTQLDSKWWKAIQCDRIILKMIVRSKERDIYVTRLSCENDVSFHAIIYEVHSVNRMFKRENSPTM